MENQGSIDARYRDAADPSPAVSGNAANKNTFMEKHVRICDPLPSEARMKEIVKQIFDDRHKSPGSKVPSVTGATYKSKKDIYGTIKPPANTTLFIGLAGFQEINAWIEKFVTVSNAHAEVPILGNGTVVTYNTDGSYSPVVKTGKLKLSIAVGADASFLPNKGSDLKGALNMQSKIVYHFHGTV
jgi:hypothetical protein